MYFADLPSALPGTVDRWKLSRELSRELRRILRYG